MDAGFEKTPTRFYSGNRKGQCVSSPNRLVILASGAGSLTEALIDAEKAGRLSGHIVAVGSDRESGALNVARAAGIPTFTVAPAEFASRDLWDQALTQTVALFKPTLVVSAGFMRVLGAAFLDAFEGRTINSHPALLPLFPGGHAVRDALEAGVTETGCTVHWVSAGVDTGRVIAQRSVQVLPADDEDSLHERIKEQERPLLVEVINLLS
jgi:phosphoribosylglycinamide formyltransferase-1